MANKPIQTSDIIQDKVLEKTIKEFEAWSKVVNKVESDLLDLAKVTKKGLFSIDTKQVEAVKELSNQLSNVESKTKLLNTAKTEELKLSKQVDNAKKKAIDLSIKERIEIQKVNIANRENNAQAKLIIGLAKTKAGSIENLRIKLSFVTNAWKKLTAEELENTKRGQRLVESKKQLTAELLRLERATGDSRRQVGDYGKSLSGLRGSLISVANAAGLTGGAFAAFRVLKSSITLLRDFEKANATLAGVLNKTKEETNELRLNAIELSKTSVKTAQEITELQTAYARLGFTQSQIIDVTKATVNGSIALNSGLEETAELVGAVVNSYDNLSTTDAEKITEILAASTTKTALSFEKLATALPIVSGAANAVNVPLEEVTALLGKLSDSGIDASSSATALRNVFIESASRGINYQEAIQKITDSQDKLTTANELFGKRAAVSALIVANNTEKVAELSTELEKAAVVQSLVNKEVDTLDGSIKLLSSAWEGYVLSVGDSINANETLKNGIKFLADNLETLFSIVKIGAVAFVSYKAALIATNAITKLNITLNTAASIATNARTIATNVATAAQKAFNKATKANVIGVVIALLAAAVTAYLTFADAAAQAAKRQRELNEIKKQGSEIEAKAIEIEEESSNKRLQILKNEIDVRRERGEDVLQLEKEYGQARLEEIVKQQEADKVLIKQYNDDILKLEKEAAKKKAEQAARSNRSVSFGGSSIGGSSGVASALTDQSILTENTKIQRQLDELRSKLLGQIERRNDNIKKLNDDLAKLDQKLLLNSVKVGKKLVKNQIDRNNELRLLRERLEDLRNQAIEDSEEREIAIAKTKFKREIAAIKGNSKVEIEIRIELKKALEREIQEITDKFANEAEEKRKARLEKEKAQREKEIQERLDAERKLQTELNNLVQEDLDGQIEELQRFADKQEDLSKEQIEAFNKINDLKKEKLKEQYEFDLKEQGLTNNEKLLLQKKYQNDLKELEDFDSQIQARLDQKRLDDFKELQNTITDLLQDALDKRYDKIQANLDRELEASKTQQQRLQELADKGSKDALESLQAEREKEQAIQKEKLRQERQQANIQKGIEVFKVLGKNDGNVTKTIADVTLLEAFIRTLPTAFDGTEDTGKGGKGIDNKGGFLSVLHPNERVVPKVINDKLKGISNVELGTMADVYNTLAPQLKQKETVKQFNEWLEVKKAIQDLPNKMPIQNLIFDEQEKAYINIIKRNGKTERKHTRSNGLFR